MSGNETLRIAVFGAGGVGGDFGGRLCHAGADVTFIARGEHLRAMQGAGLRLSGAVEAALRPVRATEDPGRVGVVDVVLVCVKAWQVVDAARAMGPMIGGDTIVIPLQNGMEAPTELASILGKGPVVGGLCATVSYVVEPGHVHVGGGSVTVGELDGGPSGRLEAVCARFEQAGISAEVSQDIHAAMWAKFAAITAWSGVGALTRSPAGVWGQLPESRRIFEAAVRETQAVAAAHGAIIPGAALQRILAMPDRLAPDATASLQRDIVAGRPSELDYQNGAVVRYGRQVGVATPVHEVIAACLTPQEQRARGQGPQPA